MPRRLVVFELILAELTIGNSLAASLVGKQFSPSLGRVQIAGLALDASGNTYVTGSIASPDLPTNSNAFQQHYHATTCPSFEWGDFPCRDAFVAKFDASGVLVFATYLGGSGNDDATGIAADGQGNAYVVGYTSSSDFPTTPNTLSHSGGPGVFVSKVNASGTTLIYSTLLPGAGNASAVAVDVSGNVYIAGSTTDPSFPTTPGALQGRLRGSSDGFLCKLDATGAALIYATYLGGSSDDGISGLAVDAWGSAYVTGSSISTDFPISPGAVDTRPADKGSPYSYSDAFVAKVDPSGSHLIYAARPTGSLNDWPTSIAISGDGHAYITGTTGSADFPTTKGAYLTQIGLIGGAFVTVLTPDGTALAYSTFLGAGSALTEGNGLGIAVDSAGRAFVTGVTLGGGLTTTAGAPKRCDPSGPSDGVYQGFLSELDQQGANLLFGSYLEAPGSGGIALALRPSGTIIVALAAAFGQDVVTEIDPSARRPFGVDCVANSANFVSDIVAPGEIVTIYGSQIGPADGISAQVLGGRIGTLLAGTQVFFDGIAAPVLYTREDQINAVVPFEIAGRANTTLQVEYQGQSADALQLGVQDAVPGVFHVGRTSLAAVLNQDGTLNTPANPAARGSIVTIFANGGGLMNTPVADGSIASGPPFSTISAPVAVYFWGWPGEVLYAGSAPGFVAGTLQVNARIPANMPGGGTYVDLTLKIGNIEFPGWVTIAVK